MAYCSIEGQNTLVLDEVGGQTSSSDPVKVWGLHIKLSVCQPLPTQIQKIFLYVLINKNEKTRS